MDLPPASVFAFMETLYEETSSDSNDSCRISGTSTSDESSSDEENEDLLLYPLMVYLINSENNRVLDYLLLVDSWSDKEFKQHLRLTRQTATILIEELELSGFIQIPLFGKKAISAKLSFLIFLWFISNTEPLRTISDRFNISTSSVFRVIRRVVTWLLTKSNEIIKWPEECEVVRITEEFRLKQGINNVLGAIDSTHKRISKPSISARSYCNRKKTFSINLQAVVDSNMCFRNIYCGEPGSLHDARVLRRSGLFETADTNKNILFPGDTFLLGDSAYPSLTWLVPPFKDNGHLTDQQKEFNFKHSSTRIIVEKAFGLLKKRFRRIQFFTEYRQISFVTNTIVAACILHNYCLTSNDLFNFNGNNDDCLNVINNVRDNNIPDNDIAVNRRMQLFNEMFPAAN